VEINEKIDPTDYEKYHPSMGIALGKGVRVGHQYLKFYVRRA
jgi:hypothetical protein